MQPNAALHGNFRKPAYNCHDMPPSSSSQIRTRIDDIRPTKQKPHVAVIGLGYSGLPLAILASKHYRVVGFDGDEVKIAQLHQREATFLTEEQNAQFKDARNLQLTHDPADLREADICIIATPVSLVTNEWESDLSPLAYACGIVGGAMRDDALIILESPAHPGVCEQLVLPILERSSKLAHGSIRFAHAPAPRDTRTLSETPRVVGAQSPEVRDQTIAFYRTLIDAPFVPMDTLQETEAVTLLQHAMRDINAALVNELAIGFDTAGIDIVNCHKGGIDLAASISHAARLRELRQNTRPGTHHVRRASVRIPLPLGRATHQHDDAVIRGQIARY